jgi:hypothetical protein
MRRPGVLLLLLTAGLATGLAGCAAAPKPIPAPALSFDLKIEVEGPAMEVWRIHYAGGDRMDVDISYAGGSGELAGRRLVYEPFEAKVREAVAVQRFFDLPSQIYPPVMGIDAPGARLSLTLDGRAHTVFADSWHGLANDERFARFKAVSDVILSWIAVQPRW